MTISPGKGLRPSGPQERTNRHSRRQPLEQKGNYSSSRHNAERKPTTHRTLSSSPLSSLTVHTAIINYHAFTLWFIPPFITYLYIQDELSFPSGINQKTEAGPALRVAGSKTEELTLWRRSRPHHKVSRELADLIEGPLWDDLWCHIKYDYRETSSI